MLKIFPHKNFSSFLKITSSSSVCIYSLSIYSVSSTRTKSKNLIEKQAIITENNLNANIIKSKLKINLAHNGKGKKNRAEGNYGVTINKKINQ